MKHVLSLAIFTLFMQSAWAQPVAQVSGLKLLDVYELPHKMNFRGTTVGGLSGIDYDAKRDVYYMISDDRSAINPARFYTGRIRIGAGKIDSVWFTAVTMLKAPDGKSYPDAIHDRSHTPDPEALRYDAVTGNMIWTSEGERIVKANDTVLENPAITLIDRSGNFIDTFPLPPGLRMRATQNGPRQNGVLEGVSFADGYKTVYVSLEEPRYEDGPRADTIDNNALVRIYKFDKAQKKNTAQYAYKVEPVAYPERPTGAFKVNGIPDILWIGGERFIVMERSFSTGRLPCTIRLFLADASGATDIKQIPSLVNHPAARMMSKRLLLNMDSLGIYTDNVEGMTFGPRLPNGHRTLVLVADDNFEPFEKTQFFLFEIQ